MSHSEGTQKTTSGRLGPPCTVTVPVRMAPEEKPEAQQRARAAGYHTLSEYMRQRAKR
jgi:hypothetical protein